jgi:hypothetical protein
VFARHPALTGDMNVLARLQDEPREDQPDDYEDRKARGVRLGAWRRTTTARRNPCTGLDKCEPLGLSMKRLALILATLSLAFAGAASAPAAAPQAKPPAAPVIALHKCKGTRYVHAIVGGEHKCLGTGQFCALRYQSIYRRAGFVCKRGSDGHLRLHRR